MTIDPNLQALCDAVRARDLETVQRLLPVVPELDAFDAHGLTALHCAAIACSGADAAVAMDVMRALLRAGASLEVADASGRTALYLAAEFAWTIEPVKLLLDAGANPHVHDGHGNHIVVNALADESKAHLSELTGHPVPPPPLRLPSVKLDAAQWKRAKQRLDPVFEALSDGGLIAHQDIGTTQDDAFSDCAEELAERGGLGSGVTGFCFYTRQDRDRAKRSSALALGFWGAPDGNAVATARIGQVIVDTFRAHGFAVDWTGSANSRPIVYLHADAAPPADAT
jgi:bifunctional non-homologous end joining protein LigD